MVAELACMAAFLSDDWPDNRLRLALASVLLVAAGLALRVYVGQGPHERLGAKHEFAKELPPGPEFGRAPRPIVEAH